MIDWVLIDASLHRLMIHKMTLFELVPFKLDLVLQEGDQWRLI